MSDTKAFYSAHQHWEFIEESLSDNPLRALKRDSELMREVADGRRGAIARLWENPRCLVVTRRESRLPGFDAACAALADDGWPVLIRDSGGTAVPHQPGILNFSLIFPQRHAHRYDLDAVYQALCAPIKLALEQLKLQPGYGCVEGAYCDGRYNLVVSGLKITGTAQRLVASRRPDVQHAVLAQAMLMVDCDAKSGTHLVNRFYHLAGDNRHYNPDVSTSVAEQLGAAFAPYDPSDRDLTTVTRTLIKQAFRELIKQ